MAEKALVLSQPVLASDVWALPMGAVKIEKGDNVVVLDSTGHCKTGVNTDHGWYAGVADETKDNTAGSGGDMFIRVIRKTIVRRKVDGCTAAQYGRPGFVLSSETFCMSSCAVSAGAGSMWAGTLVNWVNTTLADFDITPFASRGYSATI